MERAMKSASSIDPRLRVLFLVGAAVGIFMLPRVWMAAMAAAVLAVLWIAVGLPPARLLRRWRWRWRRRSRREERERLLERRQTAQPRRGRADRSPPRATDRAR